MTKQLFFTSGSPAIELRRVLELLGLSASEASRLVQKGRANGSDTAENEDFVVTTYQAAARRVVGAFGLTPQQRTARVLTHASRLDDVGVAKAMGLSTTAVRALVHQSDEALCEHSANRALVLEDDGMFRRHLEECCVSTGTVVVSSTRDPVLSVLAAKVFQPGLALVDLTLGGDDLAGDLAAMRIREVAPGAAVVFVTGYNRADRIAAQMPRAVALIKPITTGALTRAIAAAFQPTGPNAVA